MRRYYDGLDDDGYTIIEPYKQPYRPGSEADVGEFKPVALGGVFGAVVERAKAAMQANRTADSPIETILGAAIVVCFQANGKPLILASEPSPEAKSLLLVPQFKWAIYRSDWAIYNPKTAGALLVECDGKDFHSTVNQISHDMRKDQAAHDRGYLTMRFTGSQIHRAADECAKEIFDFVYGGANGSHS
jgi:hypothetical protein